MGMLVLKFDNALVSEIPIGISPIRIGRAPDNDVYIDNLAVSDYHARVYIEAGQLMVEDLESLNGTFLNNTRVKRESLRSGDTIFIGKHAIIVDQEHDAALGMNPARRTAAPKLDETYVFDAKRSPDLNWRNSIAQEVSNPSSERARVPSLIVLKGKVSKKDYQLSDKLTIIGKSSMATVRLGGWFAPHAAAQISRRQDGYYVVGLTKHLAKVNGRIVNGPVRLNDGDLIEVGGVSLKFIYRD
jgi:pSer/pThr/pTyr-binding forkhead associated (FHA) protein